MLILLFLDISILGIISWIRLCLQNYDHDSIIPFFSQVISMIRFLRVINHFCFFCLLSFFVLIPIFSFEYNNRLIKFPAVILLFQCSCISNNPPILYNFFSWSAATLDWSHLGLMHDHPPWAVLDFLLGLFSWIHCYFFSEFTP